MRTQIKVLGVLTCVVVLSTAIANRSWAQETAAYFKANCASCHAIGGGRLTGPDLKGVVERAAKAGKDRDWLITYIQDPQRMINSGDAYAAQLLTEARGVVMPKIVGLDAEKAGFMIDLIEAESLLEESQFMGRLPREGHRTASAFSNPYQILNSEFLQKDLNLTKEQIDQIHRYNLQYDRIKALCRNDVAKELGFTAMQKRMIAAVYEAYEQKRAYFESRRQTGENGREQEYQELLHEYRTIDQKVMEVLTKVQRQQFETMKDSWQNLGTPGRRQEGASPAAVYHEYYVSIKKGRWRSALACLTPRKQDEIVMESVFRLWDVGEKDLLEQHLDKERLSKIPEQNGFRLSRQQTEAMIVASVIDKVALLSDCFGEPFFDEDLKEPLPSVKKLEIHGNRARGTVTLFIFEESGGETKKHPYQQPVYFEKTASGWLFDAATQEEALRDAKEIRGDVAPRPSKDETVYDLLDKIF